ncbi:MAG: hypothetical protein IJ735_03180, partial [Clostridia bacterium]|nr:hypothetical protein [Clostridia bacterium]
MNSKRLLRVIFILLLATFCLCTLFACGDESSTTTLTEAEISAELSSAVDSMEGVDSAELNEEQKTIAISVKNSFARFDLSTLSLPEGATVTVYSDELLTSPVNGTVDLAVGENNYFVVATSGETTLTYSLIVTRAASADNTGDNTGGNTGGNTGDDPVVDHQHAFGDWQTITVATCTEKGLKKRTCACGEEETEEIDALGHDIVHHDGQAATCTEIGWAAYDACSRCDYTTYEEIEALGHDLIHHDGQAATCTEDGWEEYDTCTRCDYTTYQKINKLGHDIVHHAGQAATCTEDGWEEYDTCTRCDYTTYQKIDKLGHNYNSVVTAPTCTEQGYTTH